MTTLMIGLHTLSLVSVNISKDVVARVIFEYNGNDDPITYINQHETSLLGKNDNDDHLALLFP